MIYTIWKIKKKKFFPTEKPIKVVVCVSNNEKVKKNDLLYFYDEFGSLSIK